MKTATEAMIETERLRLRMFREDDLDAYAAMVGDPDVARYLGAGPLKRAEAWRQMATVLGHWRLRGYGLWAVEEKASGALVGRVGCWRPEGWPDLEVGWMLRRASWGMGYAQEAARAAIAFAFDHLDRDGVISIIHKDNLASIRTARRLGMRPEEWTVFLGFPVIIHRLDRPSATSPALLQASSTLVSRPIDALD